MRKSWLVSSFAAHERLRMALQIVGQRVQRLQRAGQFLQRLVHVW